MLPVSRLTLNVGHNRIQNYCGCIPRCPSMTDIVPYILYITSYYPLRECVCRNLKPRQPGNAINWSKKKTSLWPHRCAKKTPIWLVVDLPL